jgi:sucrose-6F-phosphate phosphohydrolase
MRMLCTDLDRTLLPNGNQPESESARPCFRKLIDKCGCVLVYVTGRHLSLLEQAIDDYQLPVPDYAITDVGTRIYRSSGETWIEDIDWQKAIDRDWAGHDAQDIQLSLRQIRELQLQEDDKQNIHKVSYYLPADAKTELLESHIRLLLTPLGVKVSCIWSHDEQTGQGLLDIVPVQSTKLNSIEFIRRRLDLHYEQVVFAGDSGNDLEVLTSPIPSVLVANAAENVRDKAIEMAHQCGNTKQLYLAQGRFTALNGNYSAGIIEGVLHYHPELAKYCSETKR